MVVPAFHPAGAFSTILRRFSRRKLSETPRRGVLTDFGEVFNPETVEKTPPGGVAYILKVLVVFPNLTKGATLDP